MKFKDVERSDNGLLTFNVETTPEEVAYLVNYAVNELLAAGVISVNQVEEGTDVPITFQTDTVQ